MEENSEKGIKIVIDKTYGTQERLQISVVLDSNEDLAAFEKVAYAIVEKRAVAYEKECADFNKAVELGEK